VKYTVGLNKCHFCDYISLQKETKNPHESNNYINFLLLKGMLFAPSTIVFRTPKIASIPGWGPTFNVIKVSGGQVESNSLAGTHLLCS